MFNTFLLKYSFIEYENHFFLFFSSCVGIFYLQFLSSVANFSSALYFQKEKEKNNYNIIYFSPIFL